MYENITPKLATRAIDLTLPRVKDTIIMVATAIVGTFESLPKKRGNKPSSPMRLVVLDPAMISESVTVSVAVKAENATAYVMGVGALTDERVSERGLEATPYSSQLRP